MSGTFDKNAFMQFLMDQGVLKFGEFTLNSGRVSPYFFNLGQVSSGAAFTQLGRAYAHTLQASGLACDVLFGPAYKGIPIAVAGAAALHELASIDVGVAYNRKEAKDHGEGGRLVGAELSGSVVLVDDVLTSGKALREAVALVADSDATISGVVIALDRQERFSDDNKTAVMQLQEDLQVPVISIAKMDDIVEFLGNSDATDSELLQAMQNYRREYCL